MIVKNEEHVIERCLSSALPFVDTWCIVDTGSTDSTMAKIKEIADKMGVKGVLHERPWVNFGHNRSELLELARELAPWSLMMDADDIFHAPPRSTHPYFAITVDAYAVTIKRGNLTYHRPVFFNNARPWMFIGAVHEYAECPGGKPSPMLPTGFWIDARCEGARSQNPRKYQDDAELLEAELLKNPTDTRSMFYAAQSWRDCNNHEKARYWYDKRMNAGGWDQERYISALNLCRLADTIEEKFVLAWKAIEICPRLEASHEVLKATREKNLWSKQAYAIGIISSKFSRNPEPTFLFVEQNVYEYSFDDEFSIHCYYMKYDDESARAAFQAMKKAPPAHQARLRQNYEFSLKRLN